MASNSLSLTYSFYMNDHVSSETDRNQGTFTGDLLASMQTYIMEFDPEDSFGRLPSILVREFGDVIAPYVILRDPNNNELEVHVTEESNKLYFDRGWRDIQYLYQTPLGCWITLTYNDPKLFAMRITNRFGNEIQYPLHNPPFRYLLERHGFETVATRSSRSNRRVGPFGPFSFVRSYVKKLTHYDVHSGTLILPWYGFGRSVFDFQYSRLVLVDYAGNHLLCDLKFGVDSANELCCMVSNGWSVFCNRYCLVEGSRVQFSVIQPAHNYTMYVSAFPQVGVETTLNYPLSDGTQIPLYVSQRLFLTRT